MVLKEGIQPIEIGFNITESALSVYTEEEITLPVVLQNNTVFDVDKIEWLSTPPMDPIAAGEVSQSMQLTLHTQTAIQQRDNPDVLVAVKRGAHASAAALNSPHADDTLHAETKDRANLIAKTSIFIGIDSLNTTLVTQWSGRIIGSLVKLDQKALTQLVLSQLG